MCLKLKGFSCRGGIRKLCAKDSYKHAVAFFNCSRGLFFFFFLKQYYHRTQVYIVKIMIIQYLYKIVIIKHWR